MTGIAEKLPHRDPFLFVDEIVSADAGETVGVKTYDDSFLFSQGHFPGRKIIPGVILVESLAQCGGAGVNALGVDSGALWGLAVVENARFLGVVEHGKTIRMVVRNMKLSGKVIKQSGTVYCDGKAVAEATWVCVRLNNS